MAKAKNDNITKNPSKVGKPFEPGQSGNPNGRPPSIRRIINEQLKNMAEDGTIDRFMRKLFEEAETNNYMMKEVMGLLLDKNLVEAFEKYVNHGEKEDTDFILYRIFKTAFDVQQQVLLSKNRFIMLMAGRRAGKTETLARKIVSVMIDGGQCHPEPKDRNIVYIHKTITNGIEQMFTLVKNQFESLGIACEESRRNEGFIKTKYGQFFIRGNSSTEEREKLRGFKWLAAIVDEAQSQSALPYLINDVLEPALTDYQGQLILAGTGPRVRGTYWEMRWTNDSKALRLNWNMSDNPFIADYKTILKQIREDKKLTETSPLYVREYLGQISYDDDALVYRLTPENYWTDEKIRLWIASQPVTDVKFSAGLDYGFVDADGFVIIMYSTSKPEKFIIHEYKARRTGVTELANAIKAGIEYVKTHTLFTPLPTKEFYIFCDTSDKKISFELATQYGLPIMDAYKANKGMAIELLQEDVRAKRLNAPENGIFADEALKTIFGRDDNDNLTRTIDDSTFHPDLIDSVLYAMRPIWLFERPNLKE